MNKVKKPLVGIGGEFDGTPYQSALYSRNGNTVTGPTMTDGKSYSDVVAYLNGYGSLDGHDLSSVMFANRPFGFTQISCGLTYQGRFFIRASHDFSLANTGTNAAASRAMFGFTGEETTNGSGPYILEALGDWKRGVFQLDASVGGLKIQTGSTGQSFSLLTYIGGSIHSGSGPTTVVAINFNFSNSVATGHEDFQVGGNLRGSNEDGDGDDTFEILGFQTDGSGNRIASLVQATLLQVGNSVSFEYLAPTTTSVKDIVPDFSRVQNLITWIRRRGFENDADDIYAGKTLEDAESMAGTASLAGIRYLLEADGRVSCNFGTNVLSLSSITNTGRSLLLRLGADGQEYGVAAGSGRFTMKNNFRAPCFLACQHGYVSLRRRVEGRDQFALLANGAIVSAGLEPIKGWDLVLRVVGPAHGYDKDLETHLREWWKHARRGLTLYPTWGDGDRLSTGGNDTRRHVDLRSIYQSSASGAERIHDLFQTAEADESASHFGKRVGGRLLLRRHTEDSQYRLEAYMNRIDVHQDITLLLLDDPTR